MRTAQRPTRFSVERLLGQALSWAVAAVWLLLGPAGLAGDAGPQKKILVLYTDRRDATVNVVLDRAIRTRLDEELTTRPDYYSESVDSTRFPEEEYQDALRDFLRRKYARERFDLVITVGGISRRFVQESGRELFPNTPVVFCGGGTDGLEGWDPGAPAAGVVERLDPKGTVDFILKLQPETRQVMVISGASVNDRFYEALARRELEGYQGRVALSYLAGLPYEELEKRIAHPPQGTALLFLTYFEDGAGRNFVAHEILPKLTQAAGAPVYGIVGTHLGTGIIGGRLLDVEAMARECAGLALRLLRGGQVKGLEVVESQSTIDMADWRELRRWGIGEDRLPPGSAVRFKVPTFWEQYKWHVLGVLALCAVQALLITVLLIERARRRRGREALHRLNAELEQRIAVQQQVEEALRDSHARVADLAGRLIVAQEEERKNIARELHDDLSQQAAALAIGLGNLERRLPDLSGPARAQLAKLEDRTSRLSEHIRLLSHALHSSTLEHVGLAEALKLHCAEFSDREDIAVAFCDRDGLGAIPPDVALCLYRVAQESLRNIAKHSGAKSAEVTLAGAGEGIELSIVDCGKGFDLQRAEARRGLGLVSMKERVRLARGSLEVKSRPGAGTELFVRVPLGRSNGEDEGFAG